MDVDFQNLWLIFEFCDKGTMAQIRFQNLRRVWVFGFRPCHRCCSKIGWECLSFFFGESFHGCYDLNLVDVWFLF
jgi:hypothetical protein